jgi:ferredoxin
MALAKNENAIIVAAIELTFQINGKTATTTHHPGTVLLQAARQAGLNPPSSCEQGNCATCMAKLVEGTVTMRVNDVLTDQEVEEGWILTCQSEPTSPTVRVDYDF